MLGEDGISAAPSQVPFVIASLWLLTVGVGDGWWRVWVAKREWWKLWCEIKFQNKSFLPFGVFTLVVVGGILEICGMDF